MKSLSVLAFLFLLLVNAISAQDVRSLNSSGQIDSLLKSNSGKTVLVNFWATWCNPCVQEFPDLVKLYRDYKDKDMVLIFISLDQSSDVKTKVIPFLQSIGVNFTTYISMFKKQEDLMDVFDKNWDGAIPATYIYNNAGVLTSSMIGGQSYAEFEKEIKKDMPNE